MKIQATMHSSFPLLVVYVVLPWLAVQISAMSNLPSEYNKRDDLDDELLQDLYKRLSRMDPAYIEDLRDSDGYGHNYPQAEDQRENRTPDIRDPEYLEHSANTGFIYMSGGAGEGKQHLKPDGSLDNTHQVKSDESLPFYCHPPNPCPKGYKSSDGCQEFVEDSADYQKEWINQMQRKGICTCDEEHMFDCSSSRSTIVGSSAAKEEHENERKELDDALNKLLEEKHDNPFGGQKRTSLVAKKSPRTKRDNRDNRMEVELEKMAKNKRNENPYLDGERLRTVAKKGSL